MRGRDRSQGLCVLWLSGSEPETRPTGEWRPPPKQHPPRGARGYVELDHYPQLMLLGEEVR